ncbi:hypothetical protein ACFLUS_00655 [Chloroflexota bacterium]
MSKELHDKAVQKIAEELFTFENSEFAPGVFYPTWVTYTNAPKRQMSVKHKWLDDLYPDIVIVDAARGNVPMVIAEVETMEAMTLEKAIQPKWRPDMDECPVLYIFVPEGSAREACIMTLDYKICYPSAWYTYAFDDEGNLRLTPV